MQYVWIAVLVLALVVEALTSDLVAIWFFPAALISLIVSFFDVPVAVQVLIFLLVGTALVFATRPLCRRLLAGKKEKTNADALIGQTCVVTEEINNLAESGEVRVGGLCWSARTEDNGAVIPVGATVTVLDIRGVKLIVK
jgi:membrane protein implicated in regulation of membrane protease activity